MRHHNSSDFTNLLIFKLFLAFLVILGASSAEAEERKGPAPMVNPDPKHRVIPELVCEWSQLGVISNEKLSFRTTETHMRLRLRSQFLYLKGTSDSEDERLIGVITRIERRRWQSDHHLIILNENLDHGTFITLENNETKIRPISCTPIDTSVR